MVMFSRNCALYMVPKSPPASRSDALPLPQYTHTAVLLATSVAMLTVGSLRRHAGSLVVPHMSVELNPPASFIAKPIMVGHKPCDGLRNPESVPAKMNWAGCQIARVNAAPPAIDRPTTALPVGAMPLLAASQEGSSW